MFSVVEFTSENSASSVALVHKDWFTDKSQTSVRCPPNNWYKFAENWKPTISMFKWKTNKCIVLKDNIGKNFYAFYFLIVID